MKPSPLLLVWLLSVPAVTPLIQPTLTRSADGLLHLYRIVALDQALQQGAFFPRWLPDLAYGYGLPLFVFYAPLSYYLSEGWHLLGLDPVTALNASFGLALFVAGTGMYLFVQDLFGSKAGLLAAVAYVYAPYQLFNVLWRGSLPIAWAGAILPFVFWAFGRLIKRDQPIYLPLSAVVCGAALLTHNISSLIILPLLSFYLALECLARYNRRTLLRVCLAMILGLGLAAFFLGPAMIEKEFAQVERVITPPDFDYHFNFVNLKELFSLPPPANTGLLNPDPPFTLGLVQVGLAVLGLLSLSGSKFEELARLRAARFAIGMWACLTSQKPELNSWGAGQSPAGYKQQDGAGGFTPPLTIVIFAVISLAGISFMMLPISAGVWDRLPLIAFVQQPHRLLSLTAFLLAILAGLAVAALPDRLGFRVTLVGIGLIFVTAVPLLYPRYYTPLPAPPTLSGMMTYEHASGAIGTTSFGEYLPVWVQHIPRESPLTPMYQTGTSIERLDSAYLPAGAKVETAVYGFNRAELVIDSPEPYQAVFHTFYFPGWEAQVDGQPVIMAPVSERGLIGVSMPPGRHRLQLYFRETPVCLAADGVSVLTLTIVIVMVLNAKTLKVITLNVFPRFTTAQFLVLTGLAVILIAGKALYLDRFDNPLKHVFTGCNVAGVGMSRQVNFGHQVNLLGYDLEPRAVVSGQTFHLTAYWQARQPLTTDYSTLAQLVDGQHHLYAGQDNLHPGGLPTSRWEPWGFAQDPHAVRVPAGTPPGDYFLIASLYEPATWSRLAVIDGGDPEWSDVVAIPVMVMKPTSPPPITGLGIAWPGEMDFGPALRLLGATPERDAIRRNDFLRVALFWEAINAPETDYRISLRLLTNEGTVILTETGRPSYGRYPTTRWVAGERVRDNHALWIPADFPAATYHLQVQVIDQRGQAVGEWVEVGTLEVEDW